MKSEQFAENFFFMLTLYRSGSGSSELCLASLGPPDLVSGVPACCRGVGLDDL